MILLLLWTVDEMLVLLDVSAAFDTIKALVA